MGDVELAKKKVVVLAAALSTFSFLLVMLPQAAVHRGLHVVWIVIPLCALAATGLVLLVKASFKLQAMRRVGGRGW